MFRLERNREYIDKQHEVLELSKRFFILAPLFISTYICQHYSRPSRFSTPTDIAIQVSSGLALVITDFTTFTNTLLIIACILALVLDIEYLYITLHEYFVYGVCWVIANKILDYEDSQKLFPGLALLQNTSYYIAIWINNKYWLIIPYAIILGYRMCLHTWKSKEEIMNISSQTISWWFCTMSYMVISYGCCFTLNTDRGILKLENIDDNFELFRYFKLDYMSIKGIATFGLFFVINTSIFMNVRWRFIAYLNALFIAVLQGLLIAYPNINEYNYIIDTISIGLNSYLFEPVRANIYSIIDYGFVWNQVPINIVFKPLITSLVRYARTGGRIFIFPVFLLSYLYSIGLVNKEFSELLL